MWGADEKPGPPVFVIPYAQSTMTLHNFSHRLLSLIEPSLYRPIYVDARALEQKKKETRGKTVERKCYVDDGRCIYLLYAYTQTSRHIENFSIVRGDGNNNRRASRLLFLLYTIDWGCRLCVCVKNLVCIAVPYSKRRRKRLSVRAPHFISSFFFSLSLLPYPFQTQTAQHGER